MPGQRQRSFFSNTVERNLSSYSGFAIVQVMLNLISFSTKKGTENEDGQHTDFAESDEPESYIQIDTDVRGRRILQVVVLSGRHLPKMDLMGSIDPFCIITFAGAQ